MATVTASGTSSLSNGALATAEAVRQAQQGLRGKHANLGLVFVTSKLPLGDVLKTARELSPNTEFVGCTTAGEFTERGLTRGGVAVLLISSDTAEFEVVSAAGARAEPGTTAKKLSANFKTMEKAAQQKGKHYSSTVLLVDGLAGTGDTVVKEMLSATKMFQQIVGGAAGDDGAFAATHVGSAKENGTDHAAAVHVFDQHPWGVGVDHGLRPKSDRMRVTKAKANVVHEIDGKPAFEAYKKFANERGVQLEAKTAGPYMIAHELGVYFLDQLAHARAPLSVGPNGELTCAAEVSEGAFVCILDGDPEQMVAAANRAAAEAHKNLEGRPAAGVLVFDCVCRGMILDRHFQREIDAVRSVFPGAPVAGFLTYGEIARFKGKLNGWHNTTAVVLAIPA